MLFVLAIIPVIGLLCFIYFNDKKEKEREGQAVLPGSVTRINKFLRGCLIMKTPPFTESIIIRLLIVRLSDLFACRDDVVIEDS